MRRQCTECNNNKNTNETPTFGTRFAGPPTPLWDWFSVGQLLLNQWDIQGQVLEIRLDRLIGLNGVPSVCLTDRPLAVPWPVFTKAKARLFGHSGSGLPFEAACDPDLDHSPE